MTEESDSPTNAPGSGAGDAAPTQAIPRIAKPAASERTGSERAGSEGTGSAKKSPAKKPASGAAQGGSIKNGSAQTGSAQTGSATQTDKGRPRPTTGATKPSPAGRTLTAAEYARTTRPSASSTAVIPAVKDVPPSAGAAPTAPTPPVAEPGSGRRASLRLTHIEPWSVTRLAFAISVAMMIVATVAVAIFWVVLDVVGVWDQINSSFTTVLSDDSSSFNINDYFGFLRVVGLTLVLSAINVVLTTVLATIAAHLYNLAAQLMGGVEVTLAED